MDDPLAELRVKDNHQKASSPVTNFDFASMILKRTAFASAYETDCLIKKF
jgi:hypothetical protein